jgi:hypothetical protein
MANPEKLATLGTQITRRKTNKTKNTTQYMLDTTIHQMKTNTTKNHNSIYAGHHHTPDEDKQSKTTTQYMLDTAIHQMKTKKNKKNQHNICWTPPYTR